MVLKKSSVNNLEELWSNALSAIKSSLKNQTAYATYFGDRKLLSIEDGKATISASNKFQAEFANENYAHNLAKILTVVSGSTISSVEYLYVEEKAPEKQQGLIREFSAPTAQKKSSKNPSQVTRSFTTALINEELLHTSHTLDTFVSEEGDNSLALHAIHKMVENPEKSSIITLYGGTGVGKTHLLQSIAHYTKKHNSVPKVVYIDAYTYLEKYVKYNSRKRKTATFYEAVGYDSSDIFLFDGLHILEGKAGTLSNIHSLFSKLIGLNKTIVITSNSSIEELNWLPKELRNSLMGGLTLPLKKAGFKSRCKIAKTRSFDEDRLSSDLVTVVSNGSRCHDVRSLQGNVSKALMFARIAGRMPSIDELQTLFDTEKVVTTTSIQDNKEVSLPEIITAVAKHYELKEEVLLSRSRTSSIAVARSVGMYVSRNVTKHSYAEIGSQFGGRVYSTAIHAYKRINKKIESDESLRSDVQSIMRKISYEG